MTQPWEFGSEFHWIDPDDHSESSILPPGARLFASGRDAMRALLKFGMQRHGWTRCHVPAYFCQHVVASLASTGIETVPYADTPLQALPSGPKDRLNREDVLLVVNCFGLRGTKAAASFARGDAMVIEDHTHDPWSDWSMNSSADYCTASLRKTLPLSDGGSLWSPRQHLLPTPPQVTPQREMAAHKKLAAMQLKRLYLEGESVYKAHFRQLQEESEDLFSHGAISGATPLTFQMLPLFPWVTWRKLRKSNHDRLAEAIASLPGIVVVSQSHDNGSCPFSVILECATPAIRDYLRLKLIAASIYPASHWPIDDRGNRNMREAADLSSRILTIPCDFRYDKEDLLRVVEVMQDSVIRQCGEARVTAKSRRSCSEPETNYRHNL